MNAHKIHALTLLVALSVLPGLHAQEEIGQGAPNRPWFRLHDLDDTSFLTRFGWGVRGLLARQRQEQVRNLYGYDIQAICGQLNDIDSEIAEQDVGIAALVKVPVGEHANAEAQDTQAWKLRPLDERENLGAVSAYCEARADNVQAGAMALAGFPPCPPGAVDHECFIVTGLRIPVENLEPVRNFWTESGVVERQSTPGWIPFSDLEPTSGHTMVYVYDNAVTNEAIGVLRLPEPSVQRLKNYLDPSGEVWIYVIPHV